MVFVDDCMFIFCHENVDERWGKWIAHGCASYLEIVGSIDGKVVVLETERKELDEASIAGTCMPVAFGELQPGYCPNTLILWDVGVEGCNIQSAEYTPGWSWA